MEAICFCAGDLIRSGGNCATEGESLDSLIITACINSIIGQIAFWLSASTFLCGKQFFLFFKLVTLG